MTRAYIAIPRIAEMQAADDAIRQSLAEGVPVYKIAKRLGMTFYAAVKRIDELGLARRHRAGSKMPAEDVAKVKAMLAAGKSRRQICAAFPGVPRTTMDSRIATIVRNRGLDDAPLPNDKPARRRCIVCSREFNSAGPQNRICDRHARLITAATALPENQWDGVSL